MAGALTIDTLNASTNVLATQNGMTGIAKAWVLFNGEDGVIRGSFNVSSITIVSSGNFLVNFTTVMPNANYSAVGSAGYGDSGNRPILVTNYAVNTASACSVATMNTGNTIGGYRYSSVAVFSS